MTTSSDSTPHADTDAALRRYYADRAASYESVYAKPERQDDLRAMAAWLPAQFEQRRVLEIACGTGWWTPHGARDAARWLATDANEETLEIARTKPLPAGRVEFRLLDAYGLEALGSETFDAAFAGFWWSHVPRARLRDWLAALHGRLEPGAVVVLMDNRFVPGSNIPIARRDADGNTYQARVLPDGRRHEVLKNFPDEADARAAVEDSGPRPQALRWHEWPHYWALSYRLA
jgi:demethylmenaquinone methyltransferase/2-methoxy-6-polyprenyl-1,4-benzoquinol methylase